MENPNLYPIRYVSKFTGLPAHVIRAWERRYNAVTPQRTQTNRRLYSESDIKRLQLLRKATAAGHSISQVATLSSDDLMQLVERNESGRKVSGVPETEYPSENTHYANCLKAVINLDRPGLESALNRASIELSRMRLIGDVIVPLFHTIGQRWTDGSLKIIHEHMASAVARSFLDDQLRSIRPDSTAPKIVIATPVGHWHEIGALIIALLAAETGWWPVYFGPNLPAEEIAAAAEWVNAKAVALSVTHSIGDHHIIHEFGKLKRLLDPGIKLYVGGAAADIYRSGLIEMGIESVSDLAAFRRDLDAFHHSHS